MLTYHSYLYWPPQITAESAPADNQRAKSSKVLETEEGESLLFQTPASECFICHRGEEEEEEKVNISSDGAGMREAMVKTGILVCNVLIQKEQMLIYRQLVSHLQRCEFLFYFTCST